MEKINNEELNEVSGGRGLNSLEYKLLERLKIQADCLFITGNPLIDGVLCFSVQSFFWDFFYQSF